MRDSWFFSSDPGATRTHDQWLKRLPDQNI